MESYSFSAEKPAKEKPERTWPKWLSVLVAVGVIVSLFAADGLYRQWEDAHTNIEGAEVLDVYKTKARRALPSYMLTIREQGAEETRNVSVGLGFWVSCEVGDSYRDIPGEPGKCYNPEKEAEQQERLDRLKEIANIKVPEFDEIDLEPYVPDETGN